MRMTRKNYLVNPRLQLTLILGANVMALASAALIATLLFYAQFHLNLWASALSALPGQPAAAVIADQEKEIVRMCILIGVLQFLLFNLTAILVSHRIAGPLYRLERHLEDVGAGKPPVDVKFRKGDLFQHLATACNKVMARMRDTPGKS